jgi:hypothetical protein
MVGGDRQRRGRGATSIKTTMGRRSWIASGRHAQTGIVRRKPQESDENYLGRRDKHFLLYIVEIGAESPYRLVSAFSFFFENFVSLFKMSHYNQTTDNTTKSYEA